ncbi:hypothetical protein H4W80_002437 [Nonomuraea angiospora]|uniref:Uncharacterized protein n=1 Tax=Nonomuraea angiospora TaxID=46172 RepID=A0ABR9LU44_9ACTN|nr:hypothetical protein [Nonomuraea angiospora]
MRRGAGSHSPRPNRAQIHPASTATASEAANRATTIEGLLRKATGTDAHSQPGSTAPATPATGTAA